MVSIYLKPLHSPSPALNSTGVRNPLLCRSRLSNTSSSCSGDSGSSPCNRWAKEVGKFKTVNKFLLFYHTNCSPACLALWWSPCPLCHTAQTAPWPFPWSQLAGFLSPHLWYWTKTVDYVPGPAWCSQLVGPPIWNWVELPHHCLDLPALPHYSATGTLLHSRQVRVGSWYVFHHWSIYRSLLNHENIVIHDIMSSWTYMFSFVKYEAQSKLNCDFTHDLQLSTFKWDHKTSLSIM